VSDVFITDNFLLSNDRAERLYHEFARDMPIIDYHCHLPPAQIARDARFENLTQIWLDGDHYKWRAMRTAGVPEHYCTGGASDWEKFDRWAWTVPQTLRNPLYHWTHLELKRPLGISDRLLSPETAEGIWQEAGARLAEDGFSCRGIIQQMNVEIICTTDDPTDSLEHHGIIAGDESFPVRVFPSFRPDKGMAVEVPEPFNAWVDKLSEVSGIDVKDDFESYLEAITQRHEYFHAMGCRLSDHGVEAIVADAYDPAEIPAIFRRVRRGNELRTEEIRRFQSAMLYHFGVMDHASGWTQQYHIGAMRSNNTRMFLQLGPDTGFDSMADAPVARPLARFLDRLAQGNQLTRTILYNLNPSDNEVIATMLGNFQDGDTPGKMQMGSGWWFLDQKHGMEAQLNALSNMGLLSQFVGMLTDSRSFLSYTRHEYFRRILCNLLGTEMQQGILPDDIDMIGTLVRDVSYHNAKQYFRFPA